MATDIVVPTLGESVTEATVAQWFKKPGEAIAVDEPILELETDKVTLEVNATAAGVLSEIAAEEGENVEVGAILGKIDAEGSASAKSPEKKEAGGQKDEDSAAKPNPVPTTSSSSGGAEAAPADADREHGPAVRKLLEESGLDASAIPATGKDGRLTKGDVLGAMKDGPAAPAQAEESAPSSAPTPAPAPLPASARASTGPREERVRMTRLRQKIAERLKEAQNTAAMLTTFNEVDMGNVMALRNAHKDAFEKKHGIKLGFMSFFVKAAVNALKEFPAVNAEIQGDEIIYKNHYDIGVAVSTPQGLVVPVVRDCDHLNFAGIEGAIAEYGRKARDGKIAMEDMAGGTFTISNGGVFGSMMSTPILNPPQSGILGMHKTVERPMAVNGKVEIRPVMYLALSYDHRIIDGREAVSFLVRIKEAIEDPQRLLLDL